MKTADPTKVICPACVHEFRAIPQDVQERLRTISHPTPVQGEALPVVAYIDDDEHTLPAYMVEIDAIVQKVDLSQFRHKLTYHAQATAEISRLQGEVDALKEKLTKQNIILGMTKLSVADKDRAIDQLETQLSDTTGQVGKLREALEEKTREADYNFALYQNLGAQPDNHPIDFDLFREVSLIHQKHADWEAITTLSIDDPSYDTFASGFKTAVGVIEQYMNLNSTAPK
jgi:hypothetical protein